MPRNPFTSQGERLLLRIYGPPYICSARSPQRLPAPSPHTAYTTTTPRTHEYPIDTSVADASLAMNTLMARG